MNTKLRTIVPLVLALACGRTLAGETLRIMPLGDSITQAADPGYRGFLYRMLVDAGYAVDFVGNMRGEPSLPADVRVDPDHEGHGGFSVGPGPSLADDWTVGDVVHPNARGQAKFARFWFKAIDGLIKNKRLPTAPYVGRQAPVVRGSVPAAGGGEVDDVAIRTR